MPKRNHVKKLAGKLYNALPRGGKKLMKSAAKRAPKEAERGKKYIDDKYNKLVWGKKR